MAGTGRSSGREEEQAFVETLTREFESKGGVRSAEGAKRDECLLGSGGGRDTVSRGRLFASIFQRRG